MVSRDCDDNMKGFEGVADEVGNKLAGTSDISENRVSVFVTEIHGDVVPADDDSEVER